ncbi:MAG TPA: aminomethyl-transferring glycine dehydrogenase subunit GcvPB [Tissierellia bacterium]|nr:aminomethyl-transferring glycine dehydrogenase subunit GcvPB [Tissierellia bacterium]
MKHYSTLIFEISREGKRGYSLPELDVPEVSPDVLKSPIREELDFPEVSENEIMRHYANMSQGNYHIDGGFYPLGSCTMKYNPKINEDIARMPHLTQVHPLQPVESVQGSLELLYELQKDLCEISGMDAVTLQPAAGAHGELAGIMMIKSYHEKNGDHQRTKMIAPDSAHGTNPATAAMVGYDLVEIKSDENGLVDLEELKKHLDDKTAGLMLTNPSTLGLFDSQVREIADLVHEAGGLLYYDGANMNAIMGKARPGDMGFDVMHYNVHKTFSTPHGGGGPGAGPVAVKKILEPFLPVPRIVKEGDKFVLKSDCPDTIGKLRSFYGNYGVLVRAFAYIRTMGPDGLLKASENAVLNANYLMHILKEDYNLPHELICMHEFVLEGMKDPGDVTTLDVAKRLLDYGFHPPTVYFPLIIKEAIMIEPTETESKQTLDSFADAMISIAKEAKETPEVLKAAPTKTPVGRIDEVYAARALILTYDDLLAYREE